MKRRIVSLILAGTTVLMLSACGGDASSADPATLLTTVSSTESAIIDSTPSDSIEVDTTADRAPATAATSDTTTADTAPMTTVAVTTATTAAPPTTVADPLNQLPGIALLEVTAGGADETRPTFSWTAPAGAASYELVVQTADGTPVWGWTGATTSVALGGEERPADVEGPTLDGPSRARVYALGADDALIAISAWVPLPG